MIEIATLKTTVELFKELVGLLDKQRKNNVDALNNNFKPLLENMQIVAKEYHNIISDIKIDLDNDDPDLEHILEELVKRRSNIVIFRNGIVGEAAAYVQQYGLSLQNQGGFPLALKT